MPHPLQIQINELQAAIDALLDRLREYRLYTDDARTVIDRGIALMTDEQVGNWTGVRSWLEADPRVMYASPAAEEVLNG